MKENLAHKSLYDESVVLFENRNECSHWIVDFEKSTCKLDAEGYTEGCNGRHLSSLLKRDTVTRRLIFLYDDLIVLTEERLEARENKDGLVQC